MEKEMHVMVGHSSRVQDDSSMQERLLQDAPSMHIVRGKLPSRTPAALPHLGGGGGRGAV